MEQQWCGRGNKKKVLLAYPQFVLPDCFAKCSAHPSMSQANSPKVLDVVLSKLGCYESKRSLKGDAKLDLTVTYCFPVLTRLAPNDEGVDYACLDQLTIRPTQA